MALRTAPKALALLTEERLERVRTSKRLYRERNREAVRARNSVYKRCPASRERARELYRQKRDAMAAEGLITLRGPGRPRKYTTHEAYLAARREQRWALSAESDRSAPEDYSLSPTDGVND